MPCFLFTYHSHGSWLPDREQGYVHWKKGLLLPDPELAELYRDNMSSDEVNFDHTKQKLLLVEVATASEYQQFRFHAAATEITHVHVLVSWNDVRRPIKLRDSIKQSLTRRMNREYEKRKWLVKGASRSHVRDQEHFDYLMRVYLPKHRGWKWEEGRGLYL